MWRSLYEMFLWPDIHSEWTEWREHFILKIKGTERCVILFICTLMPSQHPL